MGGQSSGLLFSKVVTIALAVTVVGYFVLAGHSEANPPDGPSPAAGQDQAANAAPVKSSDAGTPGKAKPKAPAARGVDAAVRLKEPMFMHSSKSGVFFPPRIRDAATPTVAADAGASAPSKDGAVPARAPTQAQPVK